MRYIYGFWSMGRPPFLLGIIPIYLLGTVQSLHDGYEIRILFLITGLLLVWLVQLMTHYINEYCDLATDLATETPTRISGGSRILVDGMVPKDMARIAGIVSLLLAIFLAIAMILLLGAGKWSLAFAGAGILLGWLYSASPLKLDSRGFGEVNIVLVSSFLVPGLSYYLQTSAINPQLLAISAPVGLITFALTLATELPDLEADRATGKRTLVVLLGRKRAVWLNIISLVLGWIILAIALVILWPFWGLILLAGSLPPLALCFTSARKSEQGNIGSMERMGLIEGGILFYAAVSLLAAINLT